MYRTVGLVCATGCVPSMLDEANLTPTMKTDPLAPFGMATWARGVETAT
jgi:hypothetical protein